MVVQFILIVEERVKMRTPILVAVEHLSTIAGQNGYPMPFLVMMHPIVAKGSGAAFGLSADLTSLSPGLGTGGGGLVPAMIPGRGNRAGFGVSTTGASAAFRALCGTGRSLGLRPTLPAVI